jgi:hypothetical protein
LHDGITDRAQIVETASDSYRFRSLEKRKAAIPIKHNYRAAGRH